MNILIYLFLAISSFVNIIVPISGSATVTPFLAILTDAHRAIALASFYFVLSGLIRIVLFRNLIRWHYVKKLLPVSVIGAVLGSLSLVNISNKTLLAIIILFTLFFIYKKIVHIRSGEMVRPKTGLGVHFIGLLSGFLQGTGLAGSDLRNNYLYAHDLTIAEIHGTTAMVGTANFLIATVIRLFTGQISIPDLTPLVFVLPFMVAGILVSRRVITKISKKREDAIIILVMAAAIAVLSLKVF